MAFQAVKNPLLLASREIVFAGVSVIASYSVVLSGGQYIKNHMDPERRDFPTLMKIATGAEAIGAALSIAVYTGLSKLTLQPGAKLYPMLSQRPPLPPLQTIAVASVAFVLGPIVNVSFSLVSAPLIQLCHNVAEDISGPKKGMEIGSSIEDCSSGDVAAASVEQVPLTGNKPLQVSHGMKMGPLMEAAVPGYTTVLKPLVEEIFFRGQLFGRLVPNLGCIPAALTSSVLFGVLHRGTEGTYFPITEAMIGLVCSLLYFRTGRLLVPFALHSGINVSFVAGSAFLSCPMTLADKYAYRAMDPVAFPVNPPELSFWERRVAENWSSIVSCLVELAATFNGKTASEDAQFLPLDFWGSAEMASKDSIFYDHQHDRLLKAPSLCNADGTLSNFAKMVMDFEIDQLFGDEDSISVDRLIEYTLLHNRLQFALHILATRPAHAESSGLLQLTMNSSPIELAEMKIQDWVDQGHLEYLLHDYQHEAGHILLEWGLETVTRSEYTKRNTKNIANCLRLGLYAEINRDLFISFCLAAGIRSSSIPELLNGYFYLARVVQKEEWVEKQKERTSEMSNAAGPD